MSYEAEWLRYDQKKTQKNRQYFARIFSTVHGSIGDRAVQEIYLASSKMYNIEPVFTLESKEATLLLEKVCIEELGREGYLLCEEEGVMHIQANTQEGILYGVFAFLRRVVMDEDLQGLLLQSKPDKIFRMLNHWDNTDGSIERGYSGNSFFFENGDIIINERTKDYARLLASVGINATVINNVNVKAEATHFITEKYLPKIAEMATLFASYGIKLYLSLNYAACIEIGGLDTADPLDERVEMWWKERMRIVYQAVPKLGGFLVKADSEGRPGPFTYGRNQAQGANMLAKAIAPFDGTIIWRCFVYNCQQDWRDTKTDRARAAYDYFYDLDGQFDDNVILQIKNGPIDFQVREPIMPLFGKLVHTRHIMEVQIAQEYTGQQIDLCYLIPWFAEILNTHTGCGGSQDKVGDILKGKNCNGCGCGIAAVANTGNDDNWTGHDLAAANLYGFGRLAWDDSLTAEQIAREWIIQTFCNIEETVSKLENILMMSWPAYEKYAAPLGVGFMVNPGFHYGPNVDGYEYSRWGTYHRADHMGIGVDRSKQGTGYAGLYNPLLGDLYETLDSCPDSLLLFFHHVPYTHILHTGETVLQHIYNTHFEGVEDVEQMIEMWNSLEGELDILRYERVLERFKRQLDNAKEWRDQINTYFYRKTGIADALGRKIY